MFVRVPGPLTVLLAKVVAPFKTASTARFRVDEVSDRACSPKSVVRFAVVLLKESAPDPSRIPFWLNMPPVTVSVRPAPVVIVPVFVNVGVVPDWLIVRLALVASIVPLLRWSAADLAIAVAGWINIVRWWSPSGFRFR